MLFVDTEDNIKPDVNEQDVVKLLETVLFSPHSNLVTKEFAINAVMKLSVRFKHSERLVYYLSVAMEMMILFTSEIKKLIYHYGNHMNVEIQQRSVEYYAIMMKSSSVR